MNINEIVNLVNKPQKYSIHTSERNISEIAKIFSFSRQYINETFNRAIFKLKNKKELENLRNLLKEYHE